MNFHKFQAAVQQTVVEDRDAQAAAGAAGVASVALG